MEKKYYVERGPREKYYTGLIQVMVDNGYSYEYYTDEEIVFTTPDDETLSFKTWDDIDKFYDKVLCPTNSLKDACAEVIEDDDLSDEAKLEEISKFIDSALDLPIVGKISKVLKSENLSPKDKVSDIFNLVDDWA